jgi:Na+/H+ antiporter NhaD/arsenite permease-like protein
MDPQSIQNAPMIFRVLWTSSIVSAFIDNIPFAAALIPVLTDLESQDGGAVYPLWWALAPGTGLGGNGMIIGSSANLVAIGLAQARGVKIGFMDFEDWNGHLTSHNWTGEPDTPR